MLPPDVWKQVDVRAKTARHPKGGLCEFRYNRLWHGPDEVEIGSHVDIDPDPSLDAATLAEVAGTLRQAGYRLDQIYGGLSCR